MLSRSPMDSWQRCAGTYIRSAYSVWRPLEFLLADAALPEKIVQLDGMCWSR
jgi:hypothetical protein